MSNRALNKPMCTIIQRNGMVFSLLPHYAFSWNYMCIHTCLKISVTSVLHFVSSIRVPSPMKMFPFQNAFGVFFSIGSYLHRPQCFVVQFPMVEYSPLAYKSNDKYSCVLVCTNDSWYMYIYECVRTWNFNSNAYYVLIKLYKQ